MEQASLFGMAVCQYDSPVPPRPVIPGALAVGGPGGGRPVGRVRGATNPRARGFSVLDEQDFVARPRARPSPQSLPPPQRIPRIRPQPQVVPSVQSLLAQPKPVIEEVEDIPTSILDDEPLLHLVPSPSPSPLRPSVLEDLPRPQPTPKPFLPTPKTIDDYAPVRPAPPRPQFRNTIQDEDLDIPTRTLPLEPVRGRPQYRPAPVPAALPQPQAPTRGSPPRQQQLSRPVKNKQPEPVSKEHDHPSRPRKPVAQVIRKYREDNEDGSITWGFENDDGTYKEETIGTDCVTRGKYGYYDPEGVRREFTYSSGIPCDKRDLEEDAEQQGSENGYIDYSNNRYVMPNGDSVDLDHMVKNRARKPVHSHQYYNN